MTGENVPPADGPDPGERLDLTRIRIDYVDAATGEVPEADALGAGWFAPLQAWLAAAIAAPEVAEPNAMVLATIDPDGRPRTRTVLCKGVEPDGIRWYTNYSSAKGRALAHTPFASATFLWQPLLRQVHLRGPVRRTDPEETQTYWRARPRGAQLGAWASAQSRPLASRDELGRNYAAAEARFAGIEPIPVPGDWGGYVLAPVEVEFWRGGHDRLHDRLVVDCPAAGDRPALGGADPGWRVRRLQP